MSSVLSVTQATSYYSPSAVVKSDNRISQVSQSVFQKVLGTISFTWNSVATLLHLAGDRITFIFFGVIEYVCPVIGPKIHQSFLYARLTVESFFNNQTVEDMNDEIEILQERVAELRGARDQNNQLTQEVQQLRQENERLLQDKQELSQTNEATAQRIQWMLDQQPDVLARQEAVIHERDLMVRSNTELRQLNETLIQESNSAKQNMSAALESKETLEHELAKARQEATDLRVQIHGKGEMEKTIQEIRQAVQQIPRTGPKSGLDDQLEDLLSHLIRRIAATRELLQKAKEKVPARSLIEVPLRSFEGQLDELTELLNTVPEMFHLHSKYNDLLNLMIHSQQVEV